MAGRPPEVAGIENMVGLFINTLPLRVQLPPGMALLELLRQVQASQSRLMEHQHLGLAQVQGLFEVCPESRHADGRAHGVEMGHRDVIRAFTTGGANHALGTLRQRMAQSSKLPRLFNLFQLRPRLPGAPTFLKLRLGLFQGRRAIRARHWSVDGQRPEPALNGFRAQIFVGFQPKFISDLKR